MRKSITEQKEITKVVEVVVSESVQCNKCGKECDKGEEFNENMNNFYFGFGWGSRYDGETWDFDLCEECLVDIIKSFKVVPNGFKQDPSLYPVEKDHQKVFDLWKITGEWHSFINYTVEEIEEFRGVFKEEFINDLIDKCKAGRLEY
jgi:hypothetical protein